MSRVLILCVLLGFGSSVLAGDFKAGIGVDIQSESAAINFPLHLTETFFLEPSLSYSKRDFDYYDREIYSLGAGFYGKTEIEENILIYYGGGLFVSGGDVDGIMLSPSFGIEYFIRDAISISAEVGLEYFDYDHGESESQTFSGLIARFYFL